MPVRWIIGVVLIGLLTVTAAGQDAERYAPRTPPRDETPATLPKGDTPKDTDADGGAVLHPELRGIVFVGSLEQFDPAGVTVEGLDVRVPLLDDAEFLDAVRPHLGQPLAMGRLQAITAAVVSFFEAHDRPVVDALAPQQDVTGGVVQIVVLEGRVGQVRVEGNRHVPEHRLRKAVRLEPGDAISKRTLLADLDWLNANPFRRVDLIFQRGQAVGETDLVLHTQDRYPLRIYGGYENTGAAATGDDRLFAGFNWADAFGLDHQLNYQYTTSPDRDDFEAHWASYVAPLPWRHTLTLLGGRSLSRSRVAGGVFDSEGESWQIGARYDVPFDPIDDYRHFLRFGFDFKRSDNNLEFGGASVFATDTDILQWSVGYHAQAVDDFGATRGAVTLVASPGNLTANNDDDAFTIARPGAEARYAYLNIQLQRDTRLPYDLTLVTRAEAQWASGPLLGSEQLGVGGMYSVRGYAERAGNGDSGVVLSHELLTPPLRVAPLLGFDIPDELRFAAFFDYGVAVMRGDGPGDDHVTFAGAGPGLRYRLSDCVSIRYDYGFQIHDAGQRGNGRHHLSVLVSWSF